MPELEAPLFSPEGESKGNLPLDPAVFGIEPNMAVLHQVVTGQLAAARSGTASTKTRSEARGGGRKPWRQKMTGRARHGSIRSPIWVGGGVAFGPRPRDYAQRTPKKMRRLALRSALSARASEGALRVVERFDWAMPKTKDASALLAGLGIDDGPVLVVVGSGDTVAERSFRNLSQVMVVRDDQLTPYDVLWADNVVFTTDSLAAAQHRAGSGGRAYEVSDEDFVKEDGGDRGRDDVEEAAPEAEEAAS